MQDLLPERIEPVRLAERGTRLAGILELSRMKRLSSSLYCADGCVEVAVQFDADDEGNRFVTGWWSTQLKVTCQRCLEPMEITLGRDIRLELVDGTRESGRMPVDFEPMRVCDTASLVEMVEDEVILALPMVLMHAAGVCPRAGQSKGDTPAPAVKTKSPFAVLAKLRVDAE